MSKTYRYLINRDHVLWPQHKSHKEVLELKRTTPPSVFESTYQGNPSPPGGGIFQRDWWDAGKHPERRFHFHDVHIYPIARWLSWDTAHKDKDDDAWSVCIVGELLADYRLAITNVWRERVRFPSLIAQMEIMADEYSRDGLLRGIIIEDKASGISAIQTIDESAPEEISSLVEAFQPHGKKEVRARLASQWVANGSVIIPHPGESAPWLFDLEDEMYSSPTGTFHDQVDAFSQMCLYLEHILGEGLRARESLIIDAQ